MERWRSDAEELRRTEPELYEQILAQADTDDPRIAGSVADDPDAFVALFLAAANEAELR